MKEPKPDSTSPLARAPAGTPDVPDWARRLAVLLDGAVTIPGTNVKIGLDPILGLLLPELGDALTAVLSLSLLAAAVKRRVPKVVLGRMLLNIALDAVLGAIPLFGDVFDFAFRANERNLALLEQHLGDPSRKPTLGDRLVVAALVAAGLALVALPLALSVLLVRWLVTR